MTFGAKARAVFLSMVATGGPIVLVLLGLTLFRHPSLYQVATRVIVVDDALEPADAIYVLNGAVSVRAQHAAEVYHEGVAPLILIPHAREMVRRPDRPLSEFIAEEIADRGVPRDAIEIVPFRGGVVNTRDEARALRQHVERKSLDRVIVVTTDYHTGRARRTLRQELRGTGVKLSMAAAPGPGGITPGNWWESREGRGVYGEELIKQIGTLLRIEREHMESFR